MRIIIYSCNYINEILLNTQRITDQGYWTNMSDCRSIIKYKIYHEVQWALQSKILLLQMANKRRVFFKYHYDDIIMSAMASHITILTIVCLTVYSRRRSRKHQSSASLAFVREFKGSVTRKMFPFVEVIMLYHIILANGLVALALVVVVLSAIIYFIGIIKHMFQSCAIDIVW